MRGWFALNSFRYFFKVVLFLTSKFDSLSLGEAGGSPTPISPYPLRFIWVRPDKKRFCLKKENPHEDIMKSVLKNTFHSPVSANILILCSEARDSVRRMLIATRAWEAKEGIPDFRVKGFTYFYYFLLLHWYIIWYLIQNPSILLF